jgi:transcriptional regulator with XRE-family HTH domain
MQKVDPMTWNIRLTQAREAAGLTKTKLGVLVGVPEQVVMQWEAGDLDSLTGENLLAIGDALDVSPAWLVRGTGPLPRQLNPTGSSDEIPSSLGERIKVARRAAGLSQEALGGVLGKSQSAVSQYELGISAPEFDVVVPLARALSVSLDWLLGTYDVPLRDIRTSILKASGMQVVSQLADALATGRISEPKLQILAALVDEFTTPK